MYIEVIVITFKMNRIENIKTYQDKLKSRYKQLIEQAYNLRQTDSALRIQSHQTTQQIK